MAATISQLTTRQRAEELLAFRLTDLSNVKPHLKEAEDAILGNVQKALTKLSEATPTYTNEDLQKLAIKGSSGAAPYSIIDGKVMLLMGLSNKLSAYTTFTGKPQWEDVELSGCVAVNNATRELEEETNGVLSRGVATDEILKESTIVLKNTGWKHFPCPVFVYGLQSEESPAKLLNRLNQKAEEAAKVAEGDSSVKAPEHRSYAWICLESTMAAQAKVNEEYEAVQARTDIDDAAKKNLLVPIYDKIVEVEAHLIGADSQLVKQQVEIAAAARRTFGFNGDALQALQKMAVE